MAKAHEEAGGVYKIGNDPDTFRLNKFILQTYSMKCYAKMYSDFTAIDYTHGGNKYGFLTGIPTGVDCLGKSVFFGLAINRSENLHDISEVINVLELNKPQFSQGILMHDDGSAFIGLGHKFKMTNILCTHHVYMNAQKAAGGLGFFREEFLQNIHTILYYPYFESDDHLLKKIRKVIDLCKASNHKESIQFLSLLENNRKKVTTFHTSKFFTAQQKANTRCEGTNSRFKGNGSLKKELLKSDLVRSINRIIHLSEHQDQESIVEITKCIQKNMLWSMYVEDTLNKSLQKANSIYDVQQVERLSTGQER